jgi:hypothetical protein
VTETNQADLDSIAIDFSFSARHTRILCDVLEDALASARTNQIVLFQAGDIAGMAINETKTVDLEDIHEDVYFSLENLADEE